MGLHIKVRDFYKNKIILIYFIPAYIDFLWNFFFKILPMYVLFDFEFDMYSLYFHKDLF